MNIRSKGHSVKKLQRDSCVRRLVVLWRRSTGLRHMAGVSYALYRVSSLQLV